MIEIVEDTLLINFRDFISIEMKKMLNSHGLELICQSSSESKYYFYIFNNFQIIGHFEITGENSIVIIMDIDFDETLFCNYRVSISADKGDAGLRKFFTSSNKDLKLLLDPILDGNQ